MYPTQQYIFEYNNIYSSTYICSSTEICTFPYRNTGHAIIFTIERSGMEATMELRLNSQCTQRSAGGNFKKLQNGGFLEHL